MNNIIFILVWKLNSNFDLSGREQLTAVIVFLGNCQNIVSNQIHMNLMQHKKSKKKNNKLILHCQLSYSKKTFRQDIKHFCWRNDWVDQFHKPTLLPGTSWVAQDPWENKHDPIRLWSTIQWEQQQENVCVHIPLTSIG